MIEPNPTFTNTRYARRHVAVLLVPIMLLLSVLIFACEAWANGVPSAKREWRFYEPFSWFREMWNG